MKVGFVGLDAMGSAIAKNLALAGHQIKTWNRSGVTLDGVETVASVAEVFATDVVFTMLSDDDAIRAVLLASGVLAQAKPGTIHVVSSTISVAFSQELAAAHEAVGLPYIAAPVLGRPDVAAKAELNILAAGPQHAKEVVAPLFAAIGRRVWDLGEEPQRAVIAKIACNMMITMAIEALAESTVLVEGSGLPRDQFFDLILGTLFGSRPYQSYSANISAERYEPGFKAVLGLKDLRLAREASAAIGKALPMLNAVHGRMAQTVDAGMGSRDWSAMADYTINRS